MAELAESGESEAIRDVLQMFLDDTRQHLDQLASAIASNDAVAVSRLGHGLKGGCAQVGALRLAQIAAELELKGRGPDYWRGLRGMFHLEFARVEAKIRAHPILTDG